MAANGDVAAVVDRTGGEDGLGLAQQLLDAQQVAVTQHDLQRGDLGIGAQHVEPIEARVLGDPRLVNGEVLGRDGLQITAEAAVADERLVFLGELGAQSVEDGLALLGVAACLGEIATDDVASLADLDLLGFELGVLTRSPRYNQRDKGRLIINDGAEHLGTAALAHAEDVFELAVLQGGNGLGVDYAAVGNNADAADAKTRAQPIDDRQERGHVGGIAGPQLGAQRPAVLIHDQPDNHLMEIRAVVFRVARTAELRAALALEGQAGGVHEDDAELGKQVAPAGEQLLLHDILAAARRQLAGSGLIRQRLAEPRHGAVEMMQLPPLGAFDAVVGSPLFRGAVRRLAGAAEAFAAGYGGIAAVALATGLAPSTIGRGLKELPQEEPSGRIRRPGAGRKPAIVKDLTLRADLERGDLRFGEQDAFLRYLGFERFEAVFH